MKICIIGIVAAGKTTFAKALSKDMGIPCYELDSIVYAQNTSWRYKPAPRKNRSVKSAESTAPEAGS